MSGLGILLQEARVEQGLSIEEVAQHTKIRAQYLIAIEAGEYGQLPGEAYVRPFIRSYAKALGLDVEQVMLEFEVRLLPTQGELASMREQRAKLRAKKRRQFTLKLFGIAVGIAGLSYLLYRLFLT